MRTRHQITLIALLSLITGTSIADPQSFGRFFTTAKQRTHLDELRKTEPEQRVKIEEQTLIIEEDIEVVETVSAGTLTVRGLVYRSDGKSTAWINDSNTFEGDASSQYMNVGDIDTDKVEVKIPTANIAVKLNVGQTFDPISKDVRDISQAQD